MAVQRHHRLRDVGLDVEDRARIEEEVDQGGVGRGGAEAERGEADSAVCAGDAEGVFQGDGEAVEGSERAACALVMSVEFGGAGEGGGEEQLGEAVCLGRSDDEVVWLW